MFKRFRFKKAYRGAALIEYVLIASLLSVALMGGYKAVGGGYQRIYDNIGKAI